MRPARHFTAAGLGPPLANISYRMLRTGIRSLRANGVDMVHTARPFSFYRKVFYGARSEQRVLSSLQGKRVVDIGCGHTPFADDSMFQACRNAGVEFYGVDPLLGGATRPGFTEHILARMTGGRGRFRVDAPGLARALPARAEDLPFDDRSVDEILCCYLLFVWLDDDGLLADIFSEFLRVLKPGGTVKLYPSPEWKRLRISDRRLQQTLAGFSISQRYVHAGFDWRLSPSMLTELRRIA